MHRLWLQDFEESEAASCETHAGKMKREIGVKGFRL
jgi:hypothetical protein